ncbi:MAG: hypothetical protein Ct9H90mP27_3630 [Gammaproteobacteria bacterium]|nr:MAG: hypothetical protein Ct9H90mP27_3630 [Gammaproteobacteria bacterium]
MVFEDVRVPADRIVGEPGNGWAQVTSELAYERSGPERFLSSFESMLNWFEHAETSQRFTKKRL